MPRRTSTDGDGVMWMVERMSGGAVERSSSGASDVVRAYWTERNQVGCWRLARRGAPMRPFHRSTASPLPRNSMERLRCKTPIGSQWEWDWATADGDVSPA